MQVDQSLFEVEGQSGLAMIADYMGRLWLSTHEATADSADAVGGVSGGSRATGGELFSFPDGNHGDNDLSTPPMVQP